MDFSSKYIIIQWKEREVLSMKYPCVDQEWCQCLQQQRPEGMLRQRYQDLENIQRDVSQAFDQLSENIKKYEELFIPEDKLYIALWLEGFLEQYITFIDSQGRPFGRAQEKVALFVELRDKVRILISDLREEISTISLWLSLENELDKYFERQERLDKEIEERKANWKLLTEIIQQKQGNARVVVKLKPPKYGEEIEITVLSSFAIKVATPKYDISAPKESKRLLQNDPVKRDINQKTFQFQHILPDNASQFQAFAQITHMVDHMISEEKSCLFAYGQQGSGKTFTLFGETQLWGQQEGSISQNMSITPRILHQIFKQLRQQEEKDIKIFKVEMIFTQLYPQEFKENGFSSKNSRKICTNFIPIPQNLDEPHLIRSPEESIKILYNRPTTKKQRSTSKNKSSSFSHFFITYRFQSSMQGLKQNEVEGGTVYIDYTLSRISEPLSQIKQQSSYINFNEGPFNRKLAEFLKNAKIIVFLTVSPELSEVQRSIAIIRFGNNFVIDNIIYLKQKCSIAIYPCFTL